MSSGNVSVSNKNCVLVNTATVRKVFAVTVALRRSGCRDSSDSSPKHDPSAELMLKPRPLTLTLPFHTTYLRQSPGADVARSRADVSPPRYISWP